MLVAEQLDVLLVEDALPHVTGLQMLAAACTYAPRTLTAVQVPYADGLVAAFDGAPRVAASARILTKVAEEIAGKSALVTLARAVLAGALLTLLSYLLHAVDSVRGRLIAFVVGFLVALGSLRPRRRERTPRAVRRLAQ